MSNQIPLQYKISLRPPDYILHFYLIFRILALLLFHFFLFLFNQHITESTIVARVKQRVLIEKRMKVIKE